MQTVTLDTPAATTVTVLLHTVSGSVRAPSSVTIPAGAVSARFSISGVRAGVDTLTAEPADSSYETAVANIQAQTSPAALKLELISNDGPTNTVVARVTDINELPYGNVQVTSTAAGKGSANASALSGSDGLVTFHWVPGAGPDNNLILAIANGPRLTGNLRNPAFAANAVVNAASFVPWILPGSIATMFGSNLANATISIDGVPATVFFSNSTQVNFLVPADLNEASAHVAATNAAGSTGPIAVPVVPISPGIFAAVNRGSYLEIYATGLGPLSNGLTVNTPQVFLEGFGASLLYSGVAPGFPGLYQVNAATPAGERR